MKTLKNKIVLVAFSVAVALTSCTTEDLNFDKRDDYSGNWICQEQGSLSGTSSYNSSITKSQTDSITIYINNFYGLGNQYKATATVDGNVLTIPTQLVDNLSVTGGGGTLIGSTINMHYTVLDNGTNDVTATYTK